MKAEIRNPKSEIEKFAKIEQANVLADGKVLHNSYRKGKCDGLSVFCKKGRTIWQCVEKVRQFGSGQSVSSSSARASLNAREGSSSIKDDPSLAT